MTQGLRAYVFNSTAGVGAELTAALKQLPHVQIAGEFGAWELLQAALKARPVDVVVIDLEGQQDSNFTCVRRVAEVAPGCFVLGVSRMRDGDTILAAMRAGCHQFVPAPIDLSDLSAALAHVKPVATAESLATCVAVMGASGGAGSTTIACNLSLELAHLSGRRCALVDMDLYFGDVGCAFDATPLHTIADVCHPGIQLDEVVLERAFHALPGNVALLARPENLRDLEHIYPDEVEKIFKTLARMAGYVVMDVPRYFNPLVIAALGAANRVLIVTQLAVPFLRNASRIMQFLVSMGAQQDKIGFVLNRANASFERLTIDDAQKHLGRPLFGVVPNDYRRVRASHDLGHPLMLEAPNSSTRQAIEAIARKLAGEHSGEAESGDAEDGPGFLGGFLGRKSKPKSAAK
jgi:pilus assembly protein CpaE